MNVRNFFAVSKHKKKAREHEMTVQRMAELLEIDHGCMLRGTRGERDRDCANCELVQDSRELDEMYTNVIEMVRKQIPMKTKSKSRHGAYPQIQHWCASCGTLLHGKPKYCPACGQKEKW